MGTVSKKSGKNGCVGSGLDTRRSVRYPDATTTTLEDRGCLGLWAHGVVEHALWGAGKGMAMTIRKMEYGSAC